MAKARIVDSADVSDEAKIGDGSSVWHLAQVREHAVIGENCVIGRGAYIGEGVEMGNNCKVQNYALVYEPAKLADGVFIGPAVVLTNDHYPRAVNPDGSLKSASDWEQVGVTLETGGRPVRVRGSRDDRGVVAGGGWLGGHSRCAPARHRGGCAGQADRLGRACRRQAGG